MKPNLSANPTSFAPPVSILGQTNAAINAGQPAMNQLSAQSPNFNPSLMPPANAPMPQGSPMQNFAQSAAPQQGQQQGQPKPQQPNKPPQNPLQSRADLIVKALTAHLAQLDKLLNPQQPQA